MTIFCARIKAAVLLGVLFFSPIVAADETPRMIEKSELRAFLSVVESGERMEMMQAARQTFEKGALLAADYSFLFGNYKTESDFEAATYVFLNEEAFGGIVWKIQIKVKSSDGEILDFYAGAKKEVL